MRIAPLFVLLLVAACTPVSKPRPMSTMSDAEVAALVDLASKDACIAAGGSWKRVCRAQKLTCVRRYRDAGKACSDSSQCDGRCVGDRDAPETTGQIAGVCEADSDPCGCTTEIIGGVARTICVD